ncbi:translocon-associated protein subunit alpha-like [Hydra vulgaris]|uniref:Translocon-associated protein subunit alpha n=1 Tax=Hydra vulgaris TaxID=6087 RepID=A0ABM4DNS1_HYDVU
MFKLLSVLLVLGVLLFPTTLITINTVYAEEDPVDEETATAADDEEVTTEEDTSDVKVEPEPETTAPTGKDAEEEEKQPQGLRISPDASTVVLFPDFPEKQLPAGQPIYVLVGFHNKGEKDFIIESLDASFRYPQDYSYYIQNFTGTAYNTLIKPGEEASFKYGFHPHESYGGRPFGLTIMMLYKDSDGNQYGAGVFNETVTFHELEENFDGETFFLYVLLVAVGLLVIFGINYAFNKSGFKKQSRQAATETGTQNGRTDIDYDWLPKEAAAFNKPSPRQSPKRRRVKRSTGSGEE